MPKKIKTPVSSIERLLDELCVELGFCLPSETKRRIAHEGISDVDEFVAKVFRGENLDPAAHRELYRRVKKHVTHFMLSKAIC